MSVGEIEKIKVVGEYSIRTVDEFVVVSVVNGGDMASKETSSDKAARKLAASLTNRDKIERFVRENSW